MIGEICEEARAGGTSAVVMYFADDEFPWTVDDPQALAEHFTEYCTAN